MIILRLLLLLTNLHLKLLSTQGTGADKLLSTQRVKMYLHICTNEMHKCCILSRQQSGMLLYAIITPHHQLFERNSCPDSFCRNVCPQFYVLNIVFLLRRNQNSTTSLTPIFSNFSCVLLAQWITWLTRDRCNPKVPSSIPAGGKDFP